MTLPAGTILAAYAIERLLGRGGMGEVYLATHEGLGRKVALKLLAPELAADERFRERFIAESRLAASLDHPHIVPIYEAGETDGRLFLAMRYVEGSDLGGLLEPGPLAPDRAIGLLAGIAAALDAAHDRGLVHRDVKPGNVLVARTARGLEHAYLGDFGLVKQLGSEAGFTRSGQLVGSVDYVAPEQIEGRPIDGRADVYSLACVLYTCLAGGPPYPRETEVATLWAHVQADPPLLAAADPALGPYDPVIGKGMAKDPADRYPTAGELLAAARAAATAGEAGAAGADAVAAAASAATPPPLRPDQPAIGNLPVELSSFVGREAEAGELMRLVQDSRLVTLTGPGGTGKTRLSLHAARLLADAFPDGAFFVELASITDPALAPSQVASVLGVAETAGEPIEETLAAWLQSRRLLLVLDNLEQVVGVGPFVSGLLAKCPDLHVLATSRVRLNVRSEIEYAVSPLRVPDRAGSLTADDAGRSPAVQLFTVRASAARGDFHLTDQNAAAVAAICVRVDGLPLAIELAAARVKLLSPSQILGRLDDRLAILTGGAGDLPERQQTLRATIEWSHDLLDEPARTVFRRLAVFDGGMTFAAAEAVCLDEPTGSLLESMTTLVDGNLLRPIATDDDEPRFAMLETIREYAADRLAAAGEADTAAGRHFDYFFEVGRRFEEESDSGNLDGWLKRLDRDRANLAAAMAWGLASGQLERTASLFEFLTDYTRARGHAAEARSFVAALLGFSQLEEELRGRLLHEAAVLAARQRDIPEVERYAEEALAIARRRGDARGAVGAGQMLALSAGERGDSAAEERYIAAMLEDADRSGEPRMEIVARAHVALRALRLGLYAEAAERYDEIVIRMQGIEVMRESRGTALFNRGVAELHAGRLAAAAASLAESADVGSSMDDLDLLGYVLEGYAALAAAADRPAEAARLQGAAATALAEAGSALETFEAGMNERTAAAAREALGDAGYEAEREAGAAMPVGAALDLAKALASDAAAARTERAETR
jgi:non-specific serine/threonine protein kinase